MLCLTMCTPHIAHNTQNAKYLPKICGFSLISFRFDSRFSFYLSKKHFDFLCDSLVCCLIRCCCFCHHVIVLTETKLCVHFEMVLPILLCLAFFLLLFSDETMKQWNAKEKRYISEQLHWIWLFWEVMFVWYVRNGVYIRWNVLFEFLLNFW